MEIPELVATRVVRSRNSFDLSSLQFRPIRVSPLLRIGVKGDDDPLLPSPSPLDWQLILEEGIVTYVASDNYIEVAFKGSGEGMRTD